MTLPKGELSHVEEGVKPFIEVKTNAFCPLPNNLQLETINH